MTMYANATITSVYASDFLDSLLEGVNIFVTWENELFLRYGQFLINVPEKKMDDVIALLPSLNAPTVASLYNTKWFSVEIVVSSAVVRDLIPELLKHGAEGIIEYPLNKVI